MAEENKVENEKNEKADADGGQTLDTVLKHLDSVLSACDSLSKRMDSFEEEKKAKADAEEKEAEEKEKADAESGAGKDLPLDDKPAELAADKAKKDAEEAEMADKAKMKADSEAIAKRIADVEARLPRVMSDAEHAAMADAQARADSVFHAFGKRAPRPLDGDTLPRYRRRLVTTLKSHSEAWKDVDIGALVQDSAFEVAEKQVFADALTAANHPTDLADDELRMISKTDPATGQRQNTFVGRHTFINGMKRQPRYVVGLGLPRH